MDWRQHIFAYCERGLDPGLLAEPLNAASNAMFFVAAYMGWRLWSAAPGGRGGRFEAALIGLVLTVGTGSLLFHTFATRWAAVADTVPIGLFMVAYLVYVLRRLLSLAAWAAAGLTLAFVATLPPASLIRCAGGPCLNGSVAYLPALISLAIAAGALHARRHPAARLLTAGAGLFAISLMFRSIDRIACPYTVIAASRVLGTHFLWHLLNAVLLYLLLRAAILHGGDSTGVALAGKKN